MSHFHPKFLENMEWTFCKKIKVDNKCYMKGVMNINQVHHHVRIMLYVYPDK